MVREWADGWHERALPIRLWMPEFLITLRDGAHSSRLSYCGASELLSVVRAKRLFNPRTTRHQTDAGSHLRARSSASPPAPLGDFN